MAQIIPAQEQARYDENDMRRYPGVSNGNIGEAMNIIQLRKDLHFMFDGRKFVFVPKVTSDSTCSVIHAMVYSKDLLALYHNLQLHDISGIPREYLFARFAWTLFPGMEGFLLNGVKRLVISASSPREAFLASPEKCKTFLRQLNKPKLRSQSPTERARPTEQQESIQASNIFVSIRAFHHQLRHCLTQTQIPTYPPLWTWSLQRLRGW